ncbi:LamB/YcsF family protein [Neobacillus sp. D3-1R]|uniref:LamB/YcsF family protein n=1 Tax=Neobacillus sp. D3-1R TaxID=3445778 RepID=UPI003FA0F102
MFSVDLNCDLGESFGAFKVGNDTEMMKYITSANIACGYHAGDPSIMEKTVEMAIHHGVKIGAHPGLPDLLGFGRREMNLSATDVYTMVLYQIGALHAFVKAKGTKLHHVKPHGALYNMCAVTPYLAEAVAKAVYDFDPTLILYGLANSELITAGKKYGLTVAQEVFADRTYQNDGTLTPRTEKGALITEEGQAILQTIQMVKEKRVTTLNGDLVPIVADTICLHGDGALAVEFAKRIRAVFEKEGIEVR